MRRARHSVEFQYTWGGMVLLAVLVFIASSACYVGLVWRELEEDWARGCLAASRPSAVFRRAFHEETDAKFWLLFAGWIGLGVLSFFLLSL